MLAIFNKELKQYFKSPIAYVFMAFYLVMFGINFFFTNIYSGNSDYTYVLSSITIILIIGIPILTMRLLSEEKRSKTDQLILTAPVNTSDYILGKFFAAYALFLIPTLLTILQPLALSTFGTLPWAKILGAYLGMILLASTFISVGLFISSLTESQIISAIASFAAFMLIVYLGSIKQIVPTGATSSLIFLGLLTLALVLFLYRSTQNGYVSGIVAIVCIIGIAVGYFINDQLYQGFIVQFLGWFALTDRYFSGFFMGTLDFSAVIYYISFTTVFVFLTIQVVEKRRWN